MRLSKVRSWRANPIPPHAKRNASLPILACGLVACATLAVPTVAHAQGEPARLSPPPRVDAVPRTPAITPAQVEAFAELLGEPEGKVEQRLLWDPSLASLAVAAVDARVARKSAGRTMMICGFTLLGAGATVGVVVALSGPLLCFDDACQRQKDERNRAGETIILASLGIGLLVAIPGIIKMASQTDSEAQAVNRYQDSEPGRPPIFPPGNSRALSTGSAGTPLTLSLWSFTF